MIQPTNSFHGYNRISGSQSPASKSVSAPQTDSVSDQVEGEKLSSSSTKALREALQNSPEIRPDVVARGKALAADSNYPPREIIDTLAGLLVNERSSD